MQAARRSRFPREKVREAANSGFARAKIAGSCRGSRKMVMRELMINFAGG
jgi:hypothetical protein